MNRNYSSRAQIENWILLDVSTQGEHSMKRNGTYTFQLCRYHSRFSFLIILIPALLLLCCSGSSKGSSDGNSESASTCKMTLADQMSEILAEADTNIDYTLYLETQDGANYTFSKGDSTISTTYESASTSKWVSAVIILRLVDQGILALDDRPQELIDNWAIDPSDTLYNITLANLLSFTSGLIEEPLCINLPGADFETCIKRIATLNAGNGKIPGVEFYYGSAHLQLAALMAIKAAGVNSWQDLFEDFQEQTGLFPNGAYDLPSAENPRLAGGMHWQGDEYADFIRAFFDGDLLSESTRANMMSDHTASAVIGKSPAVDAINQNWHYGFGIWLECPHEIFDCDVTAYYSSPGAFGAYPFLNTELDYFGILARQGNLGTFREGKSVFSDVVDVAEQWAVAPDKCN